MVEQKSKGSRGLNALFGGGAQTSIQALSEADEKSTDEDSLVMLAVTDIHSGTYQPRREFDPELLQKLAETIKSQGMIQPIIVRESDNGFELVAGERRWRASKIAGLENIPAIVRSMDDQTVAAVSLIENIQRAKLNPLEEAHAMERLTREFDMSHQQVGDAVGRSRTSVTNLLRLLDLDDGVKIMVDRGELDMGHARAILGVPQDEQVALANRVSSNKLTVRATENLVKNRNRDELVPKPESDINPEISAMEKQLSLIFKNIVRISHRPNGAGKIELSYSSLGELKSIVDNLA